jgi:alkylation response protein AidB-like acyl-CoA dehydrogenase
MSKNPMAASLAMLNRFSSSSLVHKLGLYKPAQSAAKVAVREGFKAQAVITRQFRAAQRLIRPERFKTVERPSDLFDLNLSEDQQLIRETAQRFAREVLRPAASAADAAMRVPANLNEQLAELGFAQLSVPDKLGGSANEAAVVTAALLTEDLAHGDMALALTALAPIGVANALVRWGSAEQQAKYLPSFAETAPPRAALAVAEPRPLFDPNELRTRATLDGDGFQLNGEKSLVPLVETADFLLVAATLVGKGPRVFIVERGISGMQTVPEPAMGLRAAGLGRVVFDDVRLPMRALLGDGVDVCDFGELIDLSRLALCALMVGTSQAVLDYVIPYCNERIAFGEPVSQRQAVAFMIANMAIEVESMRLLTLRAASRAEQGQPFHREAYLARVLCADKGLEVATNGVQLLGGHGFIKEHPVERWYRDLMAASVMEGGALL